MFIESLTNRVIMPAHRPNSLFDLYTIKDVFGVWKRSWKIILGGTLTLALFGAYWSLSSPLQYTAEASFREKNHSHGGVATNNLTALLLNQSSDSNDSSAVSTMKSRMIMEKLVQLTGLQATISPDKSSKSLLGLMADNLRVEYARFMNHKEPSIPDPIKPLLIENIQYVRETPLGLKITFSDDASFVVKIGKAEIPGTLGMPWKYQEIGFTLSRNSDEPLQNNAYNLVLHPLSHSANDISKLINITTDKEDKSLLRIRYRNENRHTAVAFVNALMQEYQDHIDAEHKKMMSSQINYLQKRQNEVFDVLQDKMKNYVETLSEDFSTLGFIDTQKAMEFLAANQHAIKTKQLAMGMEIHRMEAALEEGRSTFESLNGMVDNPHLNKLLTEIRDMKQQFASIQAALISLRPLQQENTVSAYAGVTLPLAHELFLAYNKEANVIEGQILQYQFITEQLQQPEFELSSLSAILNDPITKDISNNASTLALALNDKSNRTEKELLRLQEDLRLQRKFLSLHLKQAGELLNIKLSLLQDKIYEIRKATLGIIQQLISVAENQILELIRIRIANHKQEFTLLEKEQEELQKQMALLPKKWVSEQLIHQNMEMHKQMSREITSLVESKNISSNLEIIQSAPLDTALTPLHPDSSRFLLLTLFGAFAGLFLTTAGTFIHALAKGIPASTETLSLAGVQAAGSSSPNEIEKTLKRIVSIILSNSSHEPQSLLIVQGDFDAASAMEKLFQQRNASVQTFPWNSPKPQNIQWALAYANLSPADPEILCSIERYNHFVFLIKDESISALESLIKRLQTTEKNHQAYFIACN